LTSKAPTGHILVQMPHSLQSAETSMKVSTSSRALVGQTPTQAPQ